MTQETAVRACGDATLPKRGRTLKPGRALATLLTAGAALTGFTVLAGGADAARPMATAVLRTAQGERIGRVEFFDRGRATTVEVRLHIAGGTPVRAFHGLHVHANDVPKNGTGCVADPMAAASTWFVSADGHLKSEGENHADHLGDLPSVLVNAGGTAAATFTTDRISPRLLDGKAVILHAGRDNFGNVPVGTGVDQYTANGPQAEAKTLATGNAGDRFACGVLTVG